MINKRIFYIVNVDWFFLSHRLPLAMAMKEKGYDVYILTKDTGRKRELEQRGLIFIEVGFSRAGTNPLKDISVMIAILRNIVKFKPQIIHNVTIKPSLYGSIAAKIGGGSGLRTINAISGLGYNFIGDKKGFVQQIIKKLMNFAFNEQVNFIFQNPDDLALYRKLGYLEQNTFKLIKGAGVDHEEFSYHLPAAKEKLHVVLTARMLKDKGVMEFIEAAKLLESNWRSKVLFKLIGDIDLSNPSGISMSELKDSEIQDYFVWEGYKQDIKSILIDADIVCLPSYREGLPKSLIEAMAIGRPIVTTDVPGCRECVEDHYNGLLVAPQNSQELAKAIEVLLFNPELRLKMGEHSRKKMIKELSLDKVVSDTLGFYEEVFQ